MTTSPPPSWPRVLAVSTAGWTVVVVLHSLATYSDGVRRGLPGDLIALLSNYAPLYLPWVLLTTVLFFLLHRQPAPRTALRWVPLLSVVFYVPQVGYQILMFLVQSDRSWREFSIELGKWPTIFWLIDFGLFLFTFAVVYAIVAVRAGLDAQQQRQRAEAENLELRLQLEQQRLGALRAQLEPHFLFNALNAISGLVRGDDKPLALTALQQLSSLLRYALSASGREWVSLGDELAFVREYVTLQRLRYGDRLKLVVDGDDPAVCATDCPPLLLQPLIENAIRHDLENHDGQSDVRLSLALNGSRIVIQVTNAVRSDGAPNPGLGLGLPVTRDRLGLLYGPSATCSTSLSSDRFSVVIEMPAQAPE